MITKLLRNLNRMLNPVGESKKSNANFENWDGKTLVVTSLPDFKVDFKVGDEFICTSDQGKLVAILFEYEKHERIMIINNLPTLSKFNLSRYYWRSHFKLKDS